MRIGIDIDDTITDTWDYFIPSFSKEFNIPIDKLKKSKPYYESVKEKLSLEEYFNKVEKIYRDLTFKVGIQEDADKYINKLYNLGHEIYFITSRSFGYPPEYSKITYDMTEKYLIDHNIKFHKLIIGSSNKGEICKKEKVDILIDDSIKHCTYAKEKGIDTLLFEHSYNKDEKQFKHVKSWHEIYNYLKDR